MSQDSHHGYRPGPDFTVPEFTRLFNSLEDRDIGLLRQGFYEVMPDGNDGSFEDSVYDADEGLKWIIDQHGGHLDIFRSYFPSFFEAVD